MLSKRTKLTLCQFLTLLDGSVLDILLEKRGSPPAAISSYGVKYRSQGIRDWVMEAAPDALLELLRELVRTANTVRSQITPRYTFDERWNELQSCLELDGYRTENGNLSSIEPLIEDTIPVTDDLAQALQASDLSAADEIQRMIDASIENFVRHEPDYKRLFELSARCVADIGGCDCLRNFGIQSRRLR